MYFSPIGNVIQYVDSPQLTILGAASEHRMEQLHGVPTIGEFYPNTVFSGWNGFLVPAKTPRTIVEKIAKHVILAARDPDNVVQLKKLGMEPGGETPDEFAAQIKRELPKWAKVVREANIKAE